ncbi:hypothetical protein RFI_02590, partial [Reticulomyxa filosa]
MQDLLGSGCIVLQEEERRMESKKKEGRKTNNWYHHKFQKVLSSINKRVSSSDMQFQIDNNANKTFSSSSQSPHGIMGTDNPQKHDLCSNENIGEKHTFSISVKKKTNCFNQYKFMLPSLIFETLTHKKKKKRKRSLNPYHYHYLSDLNEIVFDGPPEEWTKWVMITEDENEESGDPKLKCWASRLDILYNCYFNWCYESQTEQLRQLKANGHGSRHKQAMERSSKRNDPLLSHLACCRQINSITIHSLFSQTLHMIDHLNNHSGPSSSFCHYPRGVKLPVTKWKINKQ